MRLSKNDYSKLEEYFKNYNDLKEQQRFRRYEILYRPSDNNSGGGKTNIPHSPVENEVITLNKDLKYRNIAATIQAVEDVYRLSTPEQKLLIEYRYWDKDPTVFEWEDIAHEMTKLRDDNKIISRHAALRMRKHILMALAKRIGWVTFG